MSDLRELCGATLPDLPMPVKGIAPWYGSKRNLAPEIVRLLGPHRTYWEPCCGSLAVLLAKPPCSMETVNDLHGDVINLARVVQDDHLAPELFGRLQRTAMCEVLHREAAQRMKTRSRKAATEVADLERAADYMVASWQGLCGMAGTRHAQPCFCKRFTNRGGHAARRWSSVVESIPAWWERLRGATILCADMFDLLPRVEDAKATALYVDPPYIETGANYVHDFKPEDHQRLADALARFKKARVVVSYYDHPLLDSLYPSWDRKVIQVTKALVSQGARGRANTTKAREVLLCNQQIELTPPGDANE